MTAPKSSSDRKRATSSATTTGSGSPAEELSENRPVLSENEPVVPSSVVDVMERTNHLLGALRVSEWSDGNDDAGRRSEAVEEGKESDERPEARLSATSFSTAASTRTSTNIADRPDRSPNLERPGMAIHIYEELLEELHDEADQQSRRPMRHRTRRSPRTAAPTADAQESSNTTSEESSPTVMDQLTMALTPEVSERHHLFIYQALMEQADAAEIAEETEITERAEHRHERRASSPCARGA